MSLDDTLNFFSMQELSTHTIADIDGTVLFSVRITAANDVSKISNISPNDICNVEIKFTSAVDEWECRATLTGQSHGVGVGLLARKGGPVESGATEVFGITHKQLTLGNGDYRITVYAKKYNIWYGGLTQ